MTTLAHVACFSAFIGCMSDCLILVVLLISLLMTNEFLSDTFFKSVHSPFWTNSHLHTFFPRF